MSSTIDRAVERVGRGLAELESVSGDVRAAKQLLALLGWDLPPGVDDIGLAQIDVSTIVARLDDLTELRAQESTSAAELAIGLAGVVSALADAIAHLDGLAGSFQGTPEYLSATDIGGQFLGRLLDVLVIGALGAVAPAAVPAGTLLGVFEFTDMPADPAIFQVEHVRQRIRWDRLSTLFTDPAGVLRDVYGWGTPDFDGNALVTNIGGVLDFLATNSRLRSIPRAVEETIVGRPVPEAESDPAAQVFVSLDKGLGSSPFDVGVTLYALRPSAPGASDGGLGLSPYAFGTTATTFDISDGLSLALSASEQLQGGLALLLRAGRGPEVLAGVLDTPVAGSSDASFKLALRSAAAVGERQTLVAAPVVTVDAAAISAGVGLEVDGEVNPSLFFGVEDGRIRLTPDGLDGFLASVLPADGITATVNLDASWSHRDGVRIHGGAGLSTMLALHEQAGPLLLESLDLALQATRDGVVASATVSGTVNLGPVTATVDSVGAAVALRFARGNLGPVDLGADFQPPTGVGVAIDAHGVVTGGGFLRYDPGQGQYAGVLQLSLHERLTLTAVGLLSTRLPDGRPGYSLLVFITADGFQPIPLGFGFQLVGIGGLVGVHRTFDQDVLAAGLKTDTLGTLLFPRDPVGNAPALLAALGAAFPVERGSYLLGLLARITWFTPTLVQLDLALALKLGGVTELLVLGRVSALLPSRDDDLLRLTMDAIGVLNFDAGTLAAQAVLVDSRLAHQFPITGAAAVQARWGSGDASGAGANFVLAVGGFNPRFTPPAGFPALERVAIALCAGANPRLLCEGYFALTANTIQFGSRAALYAEAAGFRVTGDVGFDVLVQPLPLHFVADFHAAVQLQWKSHNLAKVVLAGTLAGPVPLRLTAKATIEILWCSVSMHLDLTLNPTAALKATSVPPVALEGMVAAALATGTSWRTAPGAEAAHGVVLRRLGAGPGLVLDPLGQLLVEQTVAPLNTTRDVTTYGGAPVAGRRRFAVSGTLNGMAGSAVAGAFAPARYFTLSDDEKLVAPSFETLDAGLVLGASGTTCDGSTGASAPLVYRPLTLDAVPVGGARLAAPAVTSPGPYTLPVAALQVQRPSGAAARVPVRRVGRRRFRNEGAVPAAQVQAPEWRLVRVQDGTVAPPDPAVRTWSETRAALATLNRGGAAWQMVPAHELARS